MYKRIFSLILAAALVLAMLPAAAPRISAASNVSAEQFEPQKVSIPTTVNPLYADVLDVEDFADQLKALERPESSGGMSTMSTDETLYYSMSDVSSQLREAIKQRTGVIELYYYADSSLDVGDTALAILAAAMVHTGVPTEGDYLLWQLGTYQCDGLYGTDEEQGLNFIQMTYTLTYYTTAEQEAEMDTAVSSLLAGWDLEEATTYDKIKMAYDYICANVAYDYDNLYDDSHLLKYTGYAALVDGTAVCQGYAVLFYRLMLELGIDARVITGWQTSTGGAHAWNIVELYDQYYNLDATWDAGCTDYDYFLRSNDNFPDHSRDAAYGTADFNSAYPMSDTNFDPSTSGQCGENAYWSFDAETGTLTITGEGAMDDYLVRDPAPWFDHRESIIRVVIESGITTIGSCAFNSYPALQTIEIPDTVQAIGRGVFTLCTSLTDIELPEGITIIKDCTFADCTSLTSITLPSTLETIEMLAFSNCTALNSVVLPDRVTEVGRGAFNNCSSLASVQIGTGLTAISDNMFNSCTALTAVEIPANVTEISYEAFAFCTGLTDITFLGDAPSIYDGAFYDVTATAYYPDENDTWTEEVMQQYGGTITWVLTRILNGWVSENGSWYYYVDNVKQTGWLKSGGYWYYLDVDGVMQTGWVKVNGNRFYMNKNGVMLTGWVKVDGAWYYMASGGAVQTGWLELNGKTYYLHEDGVMATGLTEIGGVYYYFAVGGAMQTGWQTIDGVKHLFSSDGTAETGWYKTGGKWYYLKETGAVSTGWAKVNGKWYYLDADGVMQTGWIQVDGRRYYLDASGVMKTGWLQLDGKWYYLSSGGILQTGWVSVNCHWYYMNSDGVMQTGWVQVKGKWYYFASGGAMQTGWLKSGGYWYYLDASGAMVTGTQVIDGKTYVFNSNGVWIG